ncbi:hypothetical protein [Noviherbaspirillum malthae]|uniref:hypothetical protein n=1 Tax=Noviherbaspirillum malthae TaxID=1260987 RepID=UPI00188FC43E|nr:hypothetical protein [Noviherbaspirillum malthae]
MTPALENGVRIYFRRLAGNLRHVDSEIAPNDAPVKAADTLVGPPASPRHDCHVPFAIQDDITNAELALLKSIAESGSAIKLFRRVVITHDCSDLTPNQVRALRHIHASVLAKSTVPDFGAKSAFTLQLHLDYRMLPTDKRKGLPDAASDAQHLRSGVADVLRDDANRKYTRFLDIAGVQPRDPRIRIRDSLTLKIAKRIERCDPNWASLIVELTSTDHSVLQIGARLVCGKPPAKPDLSAVRAFVGRDFGYTNTTALSVAWVDEPVDLTGYAAIDDGKEAARNFFETHRAPEHVRIVERVLFRAQNFLSAIERHREAIDQYRSKIDLAYKELFPLSLRI